MYFIYQFLMKQQYIVDNFELTKGFIWEKEGITKKGLKFMTEIRNISFWNLINQDKLEELNIQLHEIYKTELYLNESSYIRRIRLCRVLNHMKPTTRLAQDLIDKYELKNKKKQEEQKAKKITWEQLEREKKIRLLDQKKKEYSYGVYGMYENGQLVYIGMTMRPFEKRWQEHIEGIQNQSSDLYFYQKINPESKIEFKILIDVSKMKANKPITRINIESMEHGLIYMLKPKYNYAGRTVEYRYS